MTEARIGGGGLTSPHLTAATDAERVAMVDRYLAEHPNGVMLLELKYDDSRSWREQMRDVDHREYMQVGVADDYAAAQFVRLGLKHPNPVIHATHNPHPLPSAPRVPYDQELSWYFPAENVISQAEVRQLMIDFVLTGEWSHAVPWRDHENMVHAGK
ncbi:MAG TPA: Imm1 family immunity protein [Pseudonocardiaceae bacterium]